MKTNTVQILDQPSNGKGEEAPLIKTCKNKQQLGHCCLILISGLYCVVTWHCRVTWDSVKYSLESAGKCHEKALTKMLMK